MGGKSELLSPRNWRFGKMRDAKSFDTGKKQKGREMKNRGAGERSKCTDMGRDREQGTLLQHFLPPPRFCRSPLPTISSTLRFFSSAEREKEANVEIGRE